MNKSIHFLLLFILPFLASCQPNGDKSVGITTILFVGNSLTYTNNLPELFTRVAKNNGVTLRTEMIAHPNYAIEDHWNDGQLQKLISSKKFSHVVVQQGPSSQAEGRGMLLEYGEKLSVLCKKHNVSLAFFMVWPAKVNYQTFDGVIKNYTDAARQTHSLLCPVGTVWKNHFDTTNDFSYYGPDEFHPSLDGSQVAAEVIFQTLFR